MSKMSQLSAQLDELRHCGEVMIGVAEALRELYTGADKPGAEESEEPERATDDPGAEKPKAKAKKEAEPEKKQLSLDDVRTVLAEKSRAGFTEQVRDIIAKHGAKKLSEIDPSEYEDVLKEVEVL